MNYTFKNAFTGNFKGLRHTRYYRRNTRLKYWLKEIHEISRLYKLLKSSWTTPMLPRGQLRDDALKSAIMA